MLEGGGGVAVLARDITISSCPLLVLGILADAGDGPRWCCTSLYGLVPVYIFSFPCLGNISKGARLTLFIYF